MTDGVQLAASPPPGMQLPQALALIAEHEQNGRLDEAEALLARVRDVAPDHPHATHLGGILAWRRGRVAEACSLMERSIALAPDAALYPRNICEVYRALGRYDEALAAGKRAVALAPDDPHARLNLGIIHYDRMEIAETLACTEHALCIAPDLPGAHFERAEALLLSGRFEEGWEEYEWRFRLPSAGKLLPETDKPQWDGKPLPGGARLLLIADQGFGDVIQFSRFIPWAAARAPALEMACSAEMRPLLAQFPQLQGLHVRWEDVPSWAAYIPLSGLPRLAGTRLDTIPATCPYLVADPELAASWSARLDRLLSPGYRRVGIAWAGRPAHNNDRNRSTALSALAPLGEVPRTALIALQKGPAMAEAGAWLGRAPLLNLGPELNDFRDTAAVLESLDLVVCVDTAVGHLAGALGRPAWLLLAHAPDWRWMARREDTPWYPSLRLFRQATPRGWTELAARVARALARSAGAGGQATRALRVPGRRALISAAPGSLSPGGDGDR